MTHPAYPDRQTLRREAKADDLLATQMTGSMRFAEALRIFTDTVRQLDFPLGSPIVGYDIKDILGHLYDWTKIEPASEDAAMELARAAA